MTDPAYVAPVPEVKTIEIEVYQPGHPSVISMTLDDIANLSTEEVSLWLRSVEEVSSTIGGWWLLMRRKEAFEANEEWGPQLARYAVLFKRKPRALHQWIEDAAKEHGLTELMDRIKAVQGGAPKRQRQLAKPKSPALKKSVKVPPEQEFAVTANYPNESKQTANSGEQDGSAIPSPPEIPAIPIPPETPPVEPRPFLNAFLKFKPEELVMDANDPRSYLRIAAHLDQVSAAYYQRAIDAKVVTCPHPEVTVASHGRYCQVCHLKLR